MDLVSQKQCLADTGGRRALGAREKSRKAQIESFMVIPLHIKPIAVRLCL